MRVANRSGPPPTMTTTRIERDPARREGRPRRRAVRHPDAARGGELPDLRAPAAARLRGRGGVDQALAPRSPTRRPAGSRRRWPTPSSRRPTRCSAGRHRDQFIVDVYQAGAGHQPQHERKRGARQPGQRDPRRSRAAAYAPVHPNDHVNMAQSTNDVIPTAMRLADAGHAARHARRARPARGGAPGQGHGSSTTS